MVNLHVEDCGIYRVSGETYFGLLYLYLGETRCKCNVISSGVRIVSGKSPAREFGESQEKPGSGVRSWEKPSVVNMFWE